MYSAIRRRFSNFGRVRVFEMTAERVARSDPASAPDGIRFEWDDPAAGWVEIRAFDGNQVLGSFRIAGHRHLDTFYGGYSMPDSTYAYASRLEVSLTARGRGLGRALVSTARQVASDEWALGFKCLIGRDNAASLHCHALAGVDRRSELDGIRLGRAVHWYRRRAMP